MYEFRYAAFDIAAFIQDLGMVNLLILIFLWGLKDKQMRLVILRNLQAISKFIGWPTIILRLRVIWKIS